MEAVGAWCIRQRAAYGGLYGDSIQSLAEAEGSRGPSPFPTWRTWVRYYTYTRTMMLAMEAAAEALASSFATAPTRSARIEVPLHWTSSSWASPGAGPARTDNGELARHCGRETAGRRPVVCPSRAGRVPGARAHGPAGCCRFNMPTCETALVYRACACSRARTSRRDVERRALFSVSERPGFRPSVSPRP